MVGRSAGAGGEEVSPSHGSARAPPAQLRAPPPGWSDAAAGAAGKPGSEAAGEAKAPRLAIAWSHVDDALCVASAPLAAAAAASKGGDCHVPGPRQRRASSLAGYSGGKLRLQMGERSRRHRAPEASPWEWEGGISP